jgi:hypothetical protein
MERLNETERTHNPDAKDHCAHACAVCFGRAPGTLQQLARYVGLQCAGKWNIGDRGRLSESRAIAPQRTAQFRSRQLPRAHASVERHGGGHAHRLTVGEALSGYAIAVA